MGEEESSISELWQLYHEGRKNGNGLSYRNKLILHYLDQVKFEAEKLHRRLPAHIKLEKLMDIGIFGLIKAVENYDHAKLARFESYCRATIRWCIIDELRKSHRISYIDCDLEEIENPRSENPYLETHKEDLKRFLTKGLSDTEKNIILMYYYNNMTDKEIGDYLGLTRSRISQKRSKVIRHLRSKLCERKYLFR